MAKSQERPQGSLKAKSSLCLKGEAKASWRMTPKTSFPYKAKWFCRPQPKPALPLRSQACAKQWQGRYVYKALLGRGSSAQVFLVERVSDQSLWALKELLPGYKSVEASLLRQLDHPGLPQLVDTFLACDQTCLVMTYVPGQTLAEKGGQLSLLQVIDIAQQLVDILIYLHGQEPPIFCLDIKPSNLIYERGKLTLLDLGVASLGQDMKRGDRRQRGTPGYAAPEQYGFSLPDQRSDIYGLGMTLHFLLTGKNPQGAGYLYQPLRVFKPELPEDLEQFVEMCTAVKPQDRFQSVQALKKPLSQLLVDLNNQKRQPKAYPYALFLLLALLVPLVLLSLVSTLVPRGGQTAQVSQQVETGGLNFSSFLALLLEDGSLNEGESQMLLGHYYGGQFAADSADQRFQMRYQLGISYLRYFRPEDNILSKMALALPFFEENVQEGQTNFQNFQANRAFYELGKFYQGHVGPSSGLLVSGYDVVESLVDQVVVVLEDSQTSSKLLLAQVVLALLLEEREALQVPSLAQKVREEVLKPLESRLAQGQILEDTDPVLQKALAHSLADLDKIITSSSERRDDK